jgi:hypothetical protein
MLKLSSLRAATLVSLSLLAASCITRPAQADLLVYKNDRLQMTVQGKVYVNPGQTVTLVHPKFGQLHFSLDSVEIHTAPTTVQQYGKLFAKAQQASDTTAMFKACVWALKHGLLEQYFDGVKKILAMDPQHHEALRVIELKRKIDENIYDSSQQAKELRALVRNNGMKIAQSKHFILLHDTPDKPAEGSKKGRGEERLELLERVYESFLLLFYSRGMELEIPKERMKVVLFNEYDDYYQFAVAQSPSLSSAAGFYDPVINTSVFYDHGTDEEFKLLQKIAKIYEKRADDAIRQKQKGQAEFIRFARTLKVLIQIAQENKDITLVSHEATHQMAGNTGLFPRHVLVPAWVHEGLATYFEAPGDATWAGIGAVNQDRLNWYKALEADREHSNIDFIVSDQVFDLAGNTTSRIFAYGQAWAMTHFMLENEFDKMMEYYRALGELPPNLTFSPETLQEVFTRVFGEDRKGLDQRWRAYMRGLKTDLDLILEDSD